MDGLESHYWQAIYDESGECAETELDGALFSEVEWPQVKTFAWIPRPESKLQVALLVRREPGYRIFARKEGMCAMQVAPGKAGVLKLTQKSYAYYLGLFADDGSDYAKDVERGVALTVAKVDWMGGFKVFLPPDGKLQVFGAFEIVEETREVGDQNIQFLQFNIKHIT